MYLSPRSAASSRASGVRRAASRVVVPTARRLLRRVGAAGWSWASDGSGMIPGADELWDSMGNVVFISATFRTRRTKSPALGMGVALPSRGSRRSVRSAARRMAEGVRATSVRRSGARGLRERGALRLDGGSRRLAAVSAGGLDAIGDLSDRLVDRAPWLIEAAGELQAGVAA